MKTTRPILLGTLISFLALVSCQRHSNEEFATSKLKANQLAVENSTQNTPENSASQSFSWSANPYLITLLGPNRVGENWEWVWSIQNIHPGNGMNGTVQDLSHWDMSLGSCFDLNSVVSAAHSNDGINWNSFTPTLQVDPSATCASGPVLKFDYGTQGNTISYYRLVVNQYYSWGISQGYYKSGKKTGCIPFYFFGLSCTSGG
jgi:hypothetical protein